MYALTGVKKISLERLLKKGEVVMEFISFVNVRTAAHLSIGDRVFLTEDTFEEMRKGSEGVVAEVTDVDISPVRIHMEHLDEVEVQRARVKVRFVSFGKVKEINTSEHTVTVLVVERALIL